MKLVRERTKEEIRTRTYESITTFTVFVREAYLRRAFLALRSALVSFDLFLTGVELTAVVGEEAETVRLRAKERAEAVAPPVELEVRAIVRVVK